MKSNICKGENTRSPHNFIFMLIFSSIKWNNGFYFLVEGVCVYVFIYLFMKAL